jgi:ATP phosphoribosyltransferase
MNKTDEVRLALPSKGSLESGTMTFLAACGLRVDKVNPRQYTAHMSAVPGVVVLFQRAVDILEKVKDGGVAMGITGYDIVAEMKEEGDSVMLLHSALGYGKCELVVAVPDSWIDVLTMDDLADVALTLREKGKALRVGTKFPNLTREFFQRHGISYYAIVSSEGAIEAGPSIGYADVIVDLTSSGTTLRDNRLKRIAGGDVLSSQACLIGNRRVLHDNPAALSAAQTILEFVDGYLAARSYCSVFANIYADSAEDAAQRVLAQPDVTGLRGPTISEVYTRSAAGQRYFAVHVTIDERNLYQAVHQLRKAGCVSITVLPVNYVFADSSPSYQHVLNRLRRGDEDDLFSESKA